MAIQPPNPPVTVPSTPDPTYQTLVATLIRSILMVLGTLGIAAPTMLQDASVVWALAGGLVLIGTTIWSFVQKYRAAKDNHANSVASVNAGRPVIITSGANP